jgi:hypothetical protein
MQITLPNSSYKIIQQIMSEIKSKFNELMIDPYANYFCQKFYEYLKLDDRLVFLEMVFLFFFYFLNY